LRPSPFHAPHAPQHSTGLAPARRPAAEPPPSPAAAALPGVASAAAVDWIGLDLLPILLAGIALFLSGLFAALRQALAQSVPARVLERAPDEATRHRLIPLLARTESLATSAGILATTFTLLFSVLVLDIVAEHRPLTGSTLLIALSVSAPLLWFVNESVARAFARRLGSDFLAQALPAFHYMQLPLHGLTWLIERARRAVMRVFGLKDDIETTRRLVADLRDVIEEADISDLDEAEREMIGNVLDFRDVDVAAVMIPRTEIEAVDIQLGLGGVAQRVAESGHSRVPVYRDTPDSILGTVSARDLVQVLAAGKLDTADLRTLLHPAYCVPETKKVSELLTEMRREKIKMAVVLDEYGGTAGLVTVGDILAEIVGDIPDEYDEDEPAPIRHLPGGAAEVEASLHVSEVNEELDLDIPEESDFETLGGFVLAQLGHFPQVGERFQKDGTEYSVLEANDRRVLRVRVEQRPA
jgi:CBS domain containing-hemolysin-like protein